MGTNRGIGDGTARHPPRKANLPVGFGAADKFSHAEIRKGERALIRYFVPDFLGSTSNPRRGTEAGTVIGACLQATFLSAGGGTLTSPDRRDRKFPAGETTGFGDSRIDK